MSIRLLVRQRSEAGGAEKATEVLLEDGDITLGRDKSCQVVLAQQAVSRSHARISKDGQLFFVEDLGSAYGTLVNGQQLPRGEKRLLRNGDVIAIAQFDVTFDRVANVPKDGAGQNASVARQVVKDVMRGLGGEGPFFRIMNGPKEGQRIEITDAQELVVGREDSADVVLKSDDLVSRRHAKIRRDWSGTHVEDLGSRNGIRVNRKRVTRKTLRDRDEVEVGNTRLLYLDPAEVREAPVVLPDEEPEGENTDHGIEDAPPPPPPQAKASATGKRKGAAEEEEGDDEEEEEEPEAEGDEEEEDGEDESSDDEEAEAKEEDEAEDEDDDEKDDEEAEDDPEPSGGPEPGVPALAAGGPKLPRGGLLGKMPVPDLSPYGSPKQLMLAVAMGIFGLIALFLIIALIAGM